MNNMDKYVNVGIKIGNNTRNVEWVDKEGENN